MLKVEVIDSTTVIVKDDNGQSVTISIGLENKEVEKGKRRKKVLNWTINQ